MYKVYITDYVSENQDQEYKILKAVGAEVTALQCKSKEELMEKASDADALLNTYLSPIDGEVMDSMKNLKVIVRYGIGYNTIDIGAATQRGIPVANVPDYCIEEVADHALALTLNLIRKVTFSSNRIKREFSYDLACLKPILPMQEACAVIIGFGRIGKGIAKRLHAFGSKLFFYDPYIEGDYDCDGVHARKVGFEEACRIGDIIILQAPAVKENYHMLKDKAFGSMLKKPYIINTARGELIDRDALLKALEEGRISGASLDVAEGMPPVSKEDRLLGFDNVILTPHSAWISENSEKMLQRLAAMEVARVLRGEWPKSLINPEVKGM